MNKVDKDKLLELVYLYGKAQETYGYYGEEHTQGIKALDEAQNLYSSIVFMFEDL